MIFQKQNQPGAISWGSILAMIAAAASGVAGATSGNVSLGATVVAGVASTIATKLP